MVSISSFHFSLIQHGVLLTFDGPIKSKIDDRLGYALGRGYPVFYSQIKSEYPPQLHPLTRSLDYVRTPNEDLHKHVKSTQKRLSWPTGSNHDPCWCDVTMPTTPPLCCLWGVTPRLSLKNQTIVFRYLVLK